MDLFRADRLKTALLALALAGLVAGLALHAAGRADLAQIAWTAAVLPVLAALCAEIVRSLSRGEVGLDIVAALSMSAALIFGEALAASVVALMYSGGTFLEAFAEGRARREMRDLLSRVPRSATRHAGGRLEEVALDAIRPGDRLLIRQGDVVPVDGHVVEGTAHLDMAALTGESLPVRLTAGQDALSGATNAGAPFDLVANRGAADSTYAGIVRLVEAAGRSRAPLSRLADRWSLGFLAVTLTIAAAAWALSGDPVRAVAVLVVATPCPLILAVPVALVAGVSRAARYGVLVKGAAALEAMARAAVLILDKTGTLTEGRPKIVSILPEIGFSRAEILRLAGAVDQASKHPVAQALTLAARGAAADLPLPERAEEVAGEGVRGRLDGRAVTVGGLSFVAGPGAAPPADLAPGSVLVAVGVEGALAGLIVLSDPLREGAHATVAALRRSGIGRLILATGDRADVAARVAEGLRLDAVQAGLSPEGKVALVQTERGAGSVVMMVGDGVNDAPALAAADVGVAMGARGAAASAEAADVVLLVDRIDPIAGGIKIARAARAIALQSVIAGIGLSILGMIAAALGWLTPVEGAILQEVIDVAVILNALRALRIRPANTA